MCFWVDYLASTIIFLLWRNLLLPHIYLNSVPVSSQAFDFTLLTFNFCATHFIIGSIGFIMIKSWMERTGNERLLNQLEEGVFLIGQETGILHFYNRASLQYNVFTK